MAEAVHNSLAEDLRRGTTSIGPHRDDLRVLLDGREARAYGSQGQQRTAVVSLKLAEAALVAGRTGERPVLLLDDVLSELDGERRSALLRQVAGAGQVIITSVEAGPFPPELISSARVWTVLGGEISTCG
jgi:DNA replication and repair protein RecF